MKNGNSSSVVKIAMVLLVAVLVASCGESISEEGVGLKVRWAADTITNCSSVDDGAVENGSQGYQQDTIPTEIRQLKLMLLDYFSGSVVAEKSVSVLAKCSSTSSCMETHTGRFEWHDVPTGNYTLKIVGYTNDETEMKLKVAWMGVHKKVSIPKSGEKVVVDVFMKRVNKITRPFNCMATPRAFHQAVEYRDGSILIFGGVSDYQAGFACSSNCDLMTATSSVEKFDPTTGQFIEMTPMARPRAFHRAIRMDDGYILIIGGASSVYFDPTQESIDKYGVHFHPANENSIEASIEIYDPTGAGRVLAGPIPLNEGRMLFDIASIPANPAEANPGELFLISGGINFGGKLNSVEIINHNFVAYKDYYPLNQPVLLTDAFMSVARVAHGMVSLKDSTRVLVIGGAEPTAENTGIAPVEFLDKPTSSFIPIDNAVGDVAFPYYSLVMLISASSTNTGRHVLVYGGMTKDDNGKFIDPKQENPSRVIAYDYEGGSQPNIVFAKASPLQGVAFAAGVLLPSGKVIVSGGAYGKDLESVSNLIEYTADGITYAPAMDDVGNPIKLRAYINPTISDPAIHGRMGHTASKLPEGGVIFIGGLDLPMGVPDTRTQKVVLGSAEILLLSQ